MCKHNTKLVDSCCNLLAVLLWSLSTDKLGRRTIINSCQTLVCVVLFAVGGLYWTGATSGNAAAATALVCSTIHVLQLSSSSPTDMFLSWSFVAFGRSPSRLLPCHTISSRLNSLLRYSEASS